MGSKGEFKEALQDCEAAFRIEPGSLALFVLSGILYARVQEFDLARERFARAVEIDPKCVVAFFSRAFVAHVNGDFKKALNDYSLALMIDSKNTTAYRLRAYIYLKKEMYANAIPDLQAALESDPGDVELNALLGTSLQRLDKLDLAIDAYSKVSYY